MADNFQHAAGAFLDAWVPEFERSVEMFTGQPVKVERRGNAGSEATPPIAGSILWQSQVFECGASGAVWIGIPAEACAAMTAPAAEEAEERESLYRSLLKQSLEGAAHVLSTGRSPRMVCSANEESAALPATPPSDARITPQAWLALRDREPAPILLWMDAEFSDLLAGKKQPLSPVPNVTADQMPQVSPLDRLADLELPIAVVLGRAALKIQEVLKLTAGSLVELDRRAGEAVEIVVHNVVVARGEVVSVSGNYGVRILEVISRRDRFAIQATAASRLPRMLPKASVN